MKLENQRRIKTTILALLAAGSMMLTTSSSLYASSQFNASPVTVATMKTAQKVAQKPQVLNSIQILLNGKKATLLYDEFNNKLKNTGIPTETGIFGADMKVSLTNDGPVTIMLEK